MVEATDVREDHDADAGLVGSREERREVVSVRRFENESSWETAAPEIGGIGGAESRSKHMLRGYSAGE